MLNIDFIRKFCSSRLIVKFKNLLTKGAAEIAAEEIKLGFFGKLIKVIKITYRPRDGPSEPNVNNVRQRQLQSMKSELTIFFEVVSRAVTVATAVMVAPAAVAVAVASSLTRSHHLST